MPIGTWGRARRTELLEQIPLFSACNQRELAQVAALTVPAEFPAGSVLTRQGASGGLAFVIATGSAEVVRGGRRLARLGPGDVVGEMSLIDGEPRSATVRALTDMEVLEISADDLRRLLRRAPTVVRKLLEALSERVRAADRLSTAGI
ncbi:MAG TPA: cyclic nucleotide-binding domain-containing protein [Acidimicrobiales bacterium]|nr:cyclic nucleotide-binding domain-containing protein [Acidimicrobiales bacterium]